MKLEKEIIDQIENSDAYYIIGVKLSGLVRKLDI